MQRILMQDRSAVFSITQPTTFHRPDHPLASHLNRQPPGTGDSCGLLWPSKLDTIIVGFLVLASTCLLNAESVTPCTHLCNLKHIGIWVAKEYGRPAAHGLGELHSGLLQASHEGLNGLHTCSMHTSAQSMKRGAGAGRGNMKAESPCPYMCQLLLPL